MKRSIALTASLIAVLPLAIFALAYFSGKEAFRIEKTANFPCVKEKMTDWPCHEAYYEALAETEGIPAAFIDLKKRHDESPYIQSVCHSIAHVLGHVGARMSPLVPEAFRRGDNFC